MNFIKQAELFSGPIKNIHYKFIPTIGAAIRLNMHCNRLIIDMQEFRKAHLYTWYIHVYEAKEYIYYVEEFLRSGLICKFGIPTVEEELYFIKHKAHYTTREMFKSIILPIRYAMAYSQLKQIGRPDIIIRDAIKRSHNIFFKEETYNGK